MREAAYVLHPIRRALNVEELVTIHYFEYDKNYQYHGESHDFWELLYADRGTIISTCDGKELVLSGGEMILLPPNCFHTLRADKSKPSNVFIISFTERSGVLDAIAGRSLRLSAAMRELIRAIIREGEAAFSLPMDRLGVQVLHEREAAPLGAQQLIKMRLEELLILLSRGQAEPCAAAEARYDDDIAGRVQALLRDELKLEMEADCVEAAMRNVLQAGWRSPDIAAAGLPQLGAGSMAELLCQQIEVAGEWVSNQ